MAQQIIAWTHILRLEGFDGTSLQNKTLKLRTVPVLAFLPPGVSLPLLSFSSTPPR